MITITNLTKHFAGANGPVKAVEKVSFSLTEGQTAAVIGKSGSGKSTLLALLGALDNPTDGTIIVGSQDVTTLHGRELLKYRRATIGFVFQSYNLIPNLSAIDNVILPMEFSGVPSAQRQARAKHLLKEVGLTDDKIHRTPSHLSGGEQQRVAIARALANKPKIILVDEPTGNLDSQTGKIIITLLRHLAKSEKTTVITVTHDQAIADQADQVFHLVDGRLQTT